MSKQLARKLSASLTPASLSQLAASRREDKLARARQARESFLLVDCSGSMSEHCEPQRAKIDALRDIVAQLRRDGAAFRQVVFGPGGAAIRDDIPAPGGGTPLHLALELAAREGARRAVVISDGIPDNQATAMAAARALGGPIDVFYVGPRPHRGEQFLTELSAASGGQFQSTDLGRAHAAALTAAAAQALKALPGGRERR